MQSRFGVRDVSRTFSSEDCTLTYPYGYYDKYFLFNVLVYSIFTNCAIF